MILKHVKIFLFALASILLPLSDSQAQATQNEQHIEVSLRMIGHQILLHSGDSTSRVLPIEKEKGQYSIQFDTEFEFIPDELVHTVNQVMKDTKIAGGYIVEMKQCETGQVVYSYEMGDLENADIIPCRTRAAPKSCYRLLFTLLGSEEQVGPSNTVNLDALEGGTFAANLMHYPLIALLLVLLIGVFIVLRRKKLQSTVDPNLIVLGDYQFDKRNTELLFNQQRIELSSKEADLLVLLYGAVNTTIEREVILKRVWGDEGNYVGRTLDVFISKLRKKLDADPKVKIANIRGVGYKLVISN